MDDTPPPALRCRRFVVTLRRDGVTSLVSDGVNFWNVGITLRVPDHRRRLGHRIRPRCLGRPSHAPHWGGFGALSHSHRHLEVVRALAERKANALAMELIPRVTRAQRMDALSSQANIAGYRSVILAAERLEKVFPLFMTAAGTIRPATVVVLGAGVAGLQAIATARRLGAVVRANDIRTAAKGEVESLGAEFITIEADEETELTRTGSIVGTPIYIR
jgi:hypothetical protein